MKRVLVTFGCSPAEAGRETVMAIKIRYYVSKIQKYGLEPVFVWPGMEINIDALYSWCSCVLMTGGGDFDASTYGETNHAENDLCYPGRDEMEFMILKKVFADKKPVLGICRGAQALAIFRGGSMIQNLPDLDISEVHGESEHLHTVENMVRARDVHPVILDEESRAFKLVGKKEFEVNSFHHQAIDVPGEGMRISGRSPEGVAEIIESLDEDHFCFGIQSHPERFETSPLDVFFEELARQASLR